MIMSEMDKRNSSSRYQGKRLREVSDAPQVLTFRILQPMVGFPELGEQLHEGLRCFNLLNTKIGVVDHGLRLPSVHDNAIALGLNARRIAPIATLSAPAYQFVVPGLLISERVLIGRNDRVAMDWVGDIRRGIGRSSRAIGVTFRLLGRYQAKQQKERHV